MTARAGRRARRPSNAKRSFPSRRWRNGSPWAATNRSFASIGDKRRGSLPVMTPMLAKLLFVAAHGDPLRHRRDGKLRFAFDGLRARRPARAVIDPFSKQADLFLRQRLAFP